MKAQTIAASVAIIANTTLPSSNLYAHQANGQVIKHGKVVYTEIVINASVDRVWNILTDFENYPAWNPFIKQIQFHKSGQERLSIIMQPEGSKPMKFTPKVLQYHKNVELRWIGKLGVSYLFDGEHTFKLIDNHNGTTTFVQYERFRGILIPFTKKMLDVNTKNSFEAMNKALKEIAEAGQLSL